MTLLSSRKTIANGRFHCIGSVINRCLFCSKMSLLSETRVLSVGIGSHGTLGRGSQEMAGSLVSCVRLDLPGSRVKLKESMFHALSNLHYCRHVSIEIAIVRGLSTNLKELDEIVKMSMDIFAHSYRALHGLNIPLLH
ncbi:hypothetical protein AMTR_s00084p00035090 [Amborella trichopoda]|uniref:Uncharacterized protein n=1 Tax=Amborella trichopoda TaxID=13333 RepID=W1NXE6_AMBTC|nr:hypothetical protein AMTR_s00084p00035090 [Amborella trichopoda]